MNTFSVMLTMKKLSSALKPHQFLNMGYQAKAMLTPKQTGSTEKKNESKKVKVNYFIKVNYLDRKPVFDYFLGEINPNVYLQNRNG